MKLTKLVNKMLESGMLILNKRINFSYLQKVGNQQMLYCTDMTKTAKKTTAVL